MDIKGFLDEHIAKIIGAEAGVTAIQFTVQAVQAVKDGVITSEEMRQLMGSAQVTSWLEMGLMVPIIVWFVWDKYAS